MLVKLLFANDEKAYEAIYLRYWRSLYAVAAWKTNDAKGAEDLVQELFMQLWNNRQKTVIEHLEAYLKMALRYSIIKFIKNRLTASKVELETIPELPGNQQTDTDMGVNELLAAFHQALEQLPEKTRLIFQMRRFEQRSISDIAQYMNLSNRAVEYHITQSLQLLRRHLRDYLPFAPLFFSMLL